VGTTLGSGTPPTSTESEVGRPLGPAPNPPVFDDVPAFIARVGRDRRFLYVNKSIAEHFGRQPEDMVGRTLVELGVSAAVADELWGRLREAFELASPVKYEHPAGVPGAENWLLTQVIPEFGADGAVDCVLAITIDITRQKRTEGALRESEARFRAFMDHCPAVAWVKGPDGRHQYVSRAMANLFGGEERWLGKTNDQVFPPEVAAATTAHDRQVRETGRPLEVTEDVPTADGQVRPWMVVKFPIPLPDGAVGTGGIALDLTERRKAEEERRATEKRLFEAIKLESLGVLAGGIAHDFNNLLTGLLGYTSLAQMDVDAGRHGSLSAYLQQIETAACRAADLCKQMLAYAGKGQFQIRPVVLNHLVEEMAQLLQASISKKAVLRFLLAPDLPAVKCDATQIRQVVMNLITNASDAIGDKSGVITLSTGAIDADQKYLTDIAAADLPPGRYVYLEVSDTGCGMSEETKARIFEPFYTTKFTGRGLGLSAIQGIIRGHNGAIRVYSQLGRGTTFKVLLPVSDQPAAPVDVSTPLPARTGRGRTVLVVEDEEDVRVFVRKALEMHGFNVLLAADGRAGVEAFRAGHPNVAAVLCDLTMPHLDGVSAFREIRRLDPTAKVVLMSGFSADEATAGLSGMGLNGFLRKPFRAQELLSVVFDAAGV
jgi:PAS domain S-box-containing protein